MWCGMPYTDKMLSTEDSKIKKFEMTLGTEFNTISTCVLLTTQIMLMILCSLEVDNVINIKMLIKSYCDKYNKKWGGL